MQGEPFDEEGFFTAIAESGVRALLIGRRALVALGIPVLTADYDLWVHIDDIERLNDALKPFELFPNHPPEESRRLGRYVLEGDERVDVLIARQVSTRDAVPLRFDDAWGRRKAIRYSERASILVPALEDLMLTKRWSMRPKDIHDLELLDILRRGEGG